MVKLVYYAHELTCHVCPGKTGKVRSNVKQIENDLSRLHTTKDVVFMAPYLQMLRYLDDLDSEQRRLGMDSNLELIKAKKFDEVGVGGTHVTRGVFREIEVAHESKTPVVTYDRRVEDEVKYALQAIERGFRLARFVVAQRQLNKASMLYFLNRGEYPDDGQDILLVRTRIVLDPQTRKDISRFVAPWKSDDEMLGGWTALNRLLSCYPFNQRSQLRDRIFDAIAERVKQRQPCGSFLKDHNLEELISAK